MKLIVGLGNPGPKYADTRHNLGFRVVDALSVRWGIDMRREKFHGFFGQGAVQSESAALLKPITFMNRSGQSVLAAVGFYQLAPADVLVISDDLALPPGVIRLRKSGSAGLHNGLQDVIDRLGTRDFPRLRIGIGAARGEVADYVTSRPTAEEAPLIAEAIVRAAEAVECWVLHGPDEAMNRYNGGNSS